MLKHKIKLGTAFLLFQAGLTVFITVIIGAFFSMYFKKVVNEHQDKLLLRSSLFKLGIAESIVLGDYSSVLKTSSEFFEQADINAVRVQLKDGTDVVSLHKSVSNQLPKLFNTRNSVEIKSEVDKTATEIAYIEVAYDLLTLDNLEKDMLKNAIFTCAVSLLISSLFIFYFSKKLRMPLEKISSTAASNSLEKIAALEPQSMIVEIGALESAISQLGKQVLILNEKEKELARSVAVGHMASQLTHDMRAPIGTFERLLFANSEDFPKMKDAIKESVSRLYTMVEALRHGEVENIVRKNWTELDFSFGKQTLQWKADTHKITLQVPDDRIEKVHIDQAKVERAWINLASNAIEFAATTVKIEVDWNDAELILRVLDDGQGVPAEFLPKLFQRGASYGKSDGTGLGLAYVRQIAQGHGGDVFYSRQNEWTIFEIHLPNSKSVTATLDIEEKIDMSLKGQNREIKKVAICLVPEELNKTIFEYIVSIPSEIYSFSTDRGNADIVVSNNEDIMFEILENDHQEYFSLAQYKEEQALMIEILKRKFLLS